MTFQASIALLEDYTTLFYSAT